LNYVFKQHEHSRQQQAAAPAAATVKAQPTFVDVNENTIKE